MIIRAHHLTNQYLFAGAAVLLTSFLFAWYLMQIQGLTEEAYRISVLENQVKNLQRQLQTQHAFSSPASSLEALAADMGFERADKIQYIRILEASVAQNR